LRAVAVEAFAAHQAVGEDIPEGLPAITSPNRLHRSRRAARSAECGTPRRSGFGRLRLRNRFGSVVVGSRRRSFLLSLQLFVVSCLFGAVALGTLKAIIRFTHQQDS
jgi:hypothetical protein